MKNGMMRTILYFVGRYKPLWAAIFAFSLIVAVLESFSLVTIIPVVNSVLGTAPGPGKESAAVTFVNSLIDILPIGDRLTASVVLLLAATLLKSVSRVAGEWVMAYSTGRILYETKKRLMEILAQQPYQYFLDNKQGKVSYFVLEAPVKIGRLIFKTAQFMSEVVMISAITALLFMLNSAATICGIVIGFFFSLLVTFIAKNISYTLGKGRMEAYTQQSIAFNEFFSGIKQIKVFSMKEAWLSRFDRFNKMFRQLYVRDFVWLAMPTNLIEFFAMATLAGAILLMKAKFGGGMISLLPVTGVFIMSLLKILPALGTIGRSRMEVLGIIPDAEAVIEILNSEVRKEATSRIELKSFRNAIRFENVSFAHSGDRPLLDKASFVIPKNSVTCIVGGSGAGKTTIINLILGLLSPTGGRILVDDRDLADYEISSIRRKAGFVSQDPFIFHSTIADNITFCSDEYSRDEIIEAARAANIHEFIASLEKGYDTMVGERGMKLSGGQQQRLTIARALIRKPDLLILDEATSAIDNKSEEEIRRSIADLTRRCTIIMVAHRLSTIKDADKILVLDKGVISEEGTHEELLERNGIYHDLYHSRETA